jgi:hypothetical protein
MRDIIEDHFAPKAAQANEVGKSYSLLLSRIETMMWDRMWGTDGYWEARRHFTFAQELHDRANMFMKLAGLGNGKFLAIHMRCVSRPNGTVRACFGLLEESKAMSSFSLELARDYRTRAEYPSLWHRRTFFAIEKGSVYARPPRIIDVWVQTTEYPARG